MVREMGAIKKHMVLLWIACGIAHSSGIILSKNISVNFQRSYSLRSRSFSLLVGYANW